MSLKDLLSVPTYTVELPSNKEKISFRPFLVKEEKVLLIAKETKDIREVYNCIKTVLENCIVSPKNIDVNKLCYFVEKGKQLGESCMVSRRTEELICAGNFDPNLVCTESINGKIIVEDQLVDFDSGGVYDVEQNQFLGIYICKDGIVSRANVNINTSRAYTQSNIVEICKKICDTEHIEYSKVDVLIFACRGYTQSVSDIQKVTPSVVTV